jgi:phage-related protein
VEIGESTLYLVRNTEDISYDSHTYTAFPFEMDATKQLAKGEIPSTSIQVCNINQVMQAYIEDLDGLIGETITIKVVSKPVGQVSYLLAATFAYDIIGCSADTNWVTWSLGAPNPLFKRFPINRFIANHCNFVGRFNQTINEECGYYDGNPATTCDGSLSRCQELVNSSHYGGFPGTGKGNVRLV